VWWKEGTTTRSVRLMVVAVVEGDILILDCGGDWDGLLFRWW
jgi:hypothetical protein